MQITLTDDQARLLQDAIDFVCDDWGEPWTTNLKRIKLIILYAWAEERREQLKMKFNCQKEANRMGEKYVTTYYDSVNPGDILADSTGLYMLEKISNGKVCLCELDLTDDDEYILTDRKCYRTFEDIFKMAICRREKRND